MNFKTTSVLFALLITMLFLFGMTLALKHKELDQGFVLPSIAKNDKLVVDTVEIDKNGKKYLFTLKGEQWYLKLPDYAQPVRAENTRVEELIKVTRGVRKTDEADVTRDLNKFGLATPEMTITLKREAAGLDATLNIGKVSEDKMMVYVNSSERKRDVLAVIKSGINELFFTDINDFRSRQLLNVNESTAKMVDLRETKGDKTIHLALERGDGSSWRFLEPKYGPADLEGDLAKPGSREVRSVRALLNTVGAIGAEDFEPSGEHPVTEKNTVLRIEVEREGGKGTVKETLLIGPKIPHAEKEKEQYYARLASEETVVRVGANRVDPLLVAVESPTRLRSHDLTQLTLEGPDRIQVKTGSGLKEDVHLYRTEPNTWQVVTPGKRMKADFQAIRSEQGGLLAALQGKRQIKDFLDTNKKDEELGLDEKKPGVLGPVAVVEVYAASLEMPKAKEAKDTKEKDKDKEKDKGKDEKAKEKDKGKGKDEKAKEVELQPNPEVKPLVTLVFSQKNLDVVNVKRVSADGGVSRFTMKAVVLEKVTQGPLAYLDTSLPGVSPIEVAKLELKRDRPDDKVDFVVEREKKEAKEIEDAGKWKLLQPKDLPNRPNADKDQVDTVLLELAKMQAKRWVEKADPKKLPYGLDNPAITVTVYPVKEEGDKAEPKPIVYKFGQEAKDKDKGHYYALIPGGGDLGDLVFLVDGKAFGTLRDAEFRDRSVVKFDSAKVKDVKLVIITPVTTTRPIFERDKLSWVVKGVEINNFVPKRVDDLIEMLADLKAAKYESFKAAGNEKVYDLGDKAPLKIDIALEDKTQHTVTIGKETADKSGYYAQYSGMPNVVFVVGAAEFRPVVAGLSFFTSK